MDAVGAHPTVTDLLGAIEIDKVYSILMLLDDSILIGDSSGGGGFLAKLTTVGELNLKFGILSLK